MRGYCLSLKNATKSWIFLLFFFAFPACSASVGRSGFREFPLSVRPGNLLGPFHGTVRDAGTKYAVQGARVFVTWDLTREGRSVRTVDREVTTDVNGAYSVPALKLTPSLRRQGALTGVRVVVFHPDYMPYSSVSQPFPEYIRDGGAGATLLEGGQPSPGVTEFVQLDNLVLLRKVASGQQANRRVLPLMGLEAVQGHLLEDYYRAALELQTAGEWTLEAGKLLMPEHVQDILEREDVPRLIREESRPDLSGNTLLFEMDRTVITVRAASMLGSTVMTRLAEMLADVETRSRLSLGTEFDADMWMFTHGGVRYGVCGLPRDGLILLIGCSEEACRPRTLRRLMRKAVSRKREIFFVEAAPETGMAAETDAPSTGGRHYTPVSCPPDVDLRTADAVELGRIFTNPGLHRWLQEVYSLPLGLYEPLAIPRAQWLRAALDELPTVLAVRPDGRGRVRALGLVLDGALHGLTNTGSEAAPEVDRVRLWFHAAAAARTPELRAHLLAHALFQLGRWVVAPDATRGPRSRLLAILGSLSGATDGDARGRVFFEDATGVRQPVRLEDPALALPTSGKLILLWPAGRIATLPWPVKPELEARYPLLLLRREP
jgi:hypothetical protein